MRRGSRGNPKKERRGHGLGVEETGSIKFIASDLTMALEPDGGSIRKRMEIRFNWREAFLSAKNLGGGDCTMGSGPLVDKRNLEKKGKWLRKGKLGNELWRPFHDQRKRERMITRGGGQIDPVGSKKSKLKGSSIRGSSRGGSTKRYRRRGPLEDLSHKKYERIAGRSGEIRQRKRRVETRAEGQKPR